ncbi:hypothetical protein BDQ17DRAFT_1329341 [Cyathus striatus]|nr:hypothetical protein BDQ17DRAFT_1329341 [Cyathus striatus]
MYIGFRSTRDGRQSRGQSRKLLPDLSASTIHKWGCRIDHSSTVPREQRVCISSSKGSGATGAGDDWSSESQIILKQKRGVTVQATPHTRARDQTGMQRINGPGTRGRTDVASHFTHSKPSKTREGKEPIGNTIKTTAGNGNLKSLNSSSEDVDGSEVLTCHSLAIASRQPVRARKLEGARSANECYQSSTSGSSASTLARSLGLPEERTKPYAYHMPTEGRWVSIIGADSKWWKPISGETQLAGATVCFHPFYQPDNVAL